jgi:hypothetical protein
MTQHIPEEFSSRFIDWSPFVIMGNTMPPRDPDEDEEDEDEDGIWLHNHQRLDGIWHQTIQPNKDQAINGTEGRLELMPCFTLLSQAKRTLGLALQTQFEVRTIGER